MRVLAAILVFSVAPLGRSAEPINWAPKSLPLAKAKEKLRFDYVPLPQGIEIIGDAKLVWVAKSEFNELPSRQALLLDCRHKGKKFKVLQTKAVAEVGDGANLYRIISQGYFGQDIPRSTYPKSVRSKGTVVGIVSLWGEVPQVYDLFLNAVPTVR